MFVHERKDVILMKKKILAVSICLLLLISAATVIWAGGNTGGTASEIDPLVSMSYIENVLLPQISNYIEQRLAGGEGSLTTPGTNYNRHFDVVEVPAGRQLIGEAGTEFILRAGSANIIASALGGISDTTNGIDLQQGAATPTNHLLIIPRSDGRGLNVTANALVMVRGRYSIQ